LPDVHDPRFAQIQAHAPAVQVVDSPSPMPLALGQPTNR
jgi:hypothetical protein